MVDHMWHSDKDDILKLYKVLDEPGTDSPFPSVCPVCGSKSGHVYMHRYDEKHHGGSWAWCSNCYSYFHGSCIVPEWWRNHSSITILQLEHSPEYLESQADLIDSLVNKLLANHSDEQKNDLPDEPGFATTYIDPVCADQTRYSIILLEGNEPSTEIVRAVNQISHRNLLKSKELILNAPQIIFEGNALDVSGMKQILDSQSINFKIEPDYPYD